MSHSEHYIPVTIAYVGGGSLNWAHTLMDDLAMDRRLYAEVRLYDPDAAAARRNARIGARYAEVSEGAAATYVVSETLEDALRGADVVVVSILPGTLAEVAADIEIPQKYGIPQAVGDTVGPGGFVRAIRAIPMLAEIGRAIAKHAPDAYVCNLTNPMSVLTGALFAAFPEIKAWGECHEVTKLRRQVAEIANGEEGAEKRTFRDVDVNVLGINHFTFVDKISIDGRDMTGAYADFIAAHPDGVFETVPSMDAEHDRYFSSKCRVKFDLFSRFGVFGAAGDRHLAEFMPLTDYLGEAENWGFALTPVEYRRMDQGRKRVRAEALAEGWETPAPKRSDEALSDQIAALMGGEPFVSNVNLPNSGQLEGLPAGTIVETNARFSVAGIEPIAAGHLPEPLHAIVADHAERQNALIAAVMQGDAAALFPLFRTDPLVAGLDDATARQLFDEMLDATRDWLPEEIKGAA